MARYHRSSPSARIHAHFETASGILPRGFHPKVQIVIWIVYHVARSHQYYHLPIISERLFCRSLSLNEYMRPMGEYGKDKSGAVLWGLFEISGSLCSKDYCSGVTPRYSVTWLRLSR
ncbi:unnamed protein product [Kuraishia capsulata CBS 1993]|uniref:Uncharacterized protein n=1 Tax=Kuraishia capsulata CBS 1993 TaxID=1382522 RepID=W6MXJ6_9ASCO|nr:uncharacterized protein KUCA_T00004991001 [Kuraishia capsulata CBS 1993]CDK29005.1 unnamed protein product [Kuraishia capsulata CBS 1993]